PTQALFVDPVQLFGAMILVAAISYVGTYAFLRRMASKGGGKVARGKRPQAVTFLSSKWITGVLIAMIAFQVLITAAAFVEAGGRFPNLEMFDLGGVVLIFAAMYHIYRYSRPLI
ncbi:MAG: hypothetical protein ACRECH_13985, partial [Nitrososphaerales archaeon]